MLGMPLHVPALHHSAKVNGPPNADSLTWPLTCPLRVAPHESVPWDAASIGQT